mmetsp:Transcript_41050/g.68962  ORF Transcript_41050/g.68962 Transcript_41050/m.68962 type:complete len:82 (-) Transcript_41050:118-363(-)
MENDLQTQCVITHYGEQVQTCCEPICRTCTRSPQGIGITSQPKVFFSVGLQMPKSSADELPEASSPCVPAKMTCIEVMYKK